MIYSNVKLLLITIIISCFHLSIFAQISGRVLDAQTNLPLSGVNVYINQHQGLTTTNSDGEYTFLESFFLNSNDSIHFSHIGYFTKKVTKEDLQNDNFVVSLVLNIQKLSEISVVGGKTYLKFFLDYEKMASMPDGLSAFGSTLHNNKLYVTGGDATYAVSVRVKGIIKNEIDDDNEDLQIKSITSDYSNKLYIYDTNSNLWEKCEIKLDKRAYHATHSYNGKLFILGGKRLSINRKIEYLNEKIEMLDLTSGKLAVEQHTNPHEAANFASFIFGDHLIVMGGSVAKSGSGRKIYSKKTHSFNLKTGYWYELPDMPTAKETNGIIVGKTIYLFGGQKEQDLKDIETYDVECGNWDTAGKLEFPVEYASAATDGRVIYVLGSGKIQVYNIETQEIKAYRIDLPTYGGRMFYVKNKLYILGGKMISKGDIEEERENNASSHLYCVSLDEFKKTATCKYD